MQINIFSTSTCLVGKFFFSFTVSHFDLENFKNK